MLRAACVAEEQLNVVAALVTGCRRLLLFLPFALG